MTKKEMFKGALKSAATVVLTFALLMAVAKDVKADEVYAVAVVQAVCAGSAGEKVIVDMQAMWETGERVMPEELDIRSKAHCRTFPAHPVKVDNVQLLGPDWEGDNVYLVQYKIAGKDYFSIVWDHHLRKKGQEA